MMRVQKDATRLEVRLQADLEHVEAAVAEVREYLAERSSPDDARLILALRELLNNAVEHGSGGDADLEIRLTVAAIGAGRYRVAVLDQGSGFDASALDLGLPESPEQIRSRGLPLVNNFADELRFEGGGCEAVMYFTLGGEAGLDVSLEDGRVVVAPGGDLTAGSARQLRERISELVAEGNTSFVFDFSKVEDIDSIALSIFVILANMLNRSDRPGGLAIRNASRDVVNMFQLTRLDRSYRIESQREQA